MPEPTFPPPSPVPAPPPEPLELKERTTRLALESPSAARERLAEGEWLAGYLWAEWARELEPAGVTREALVAELSRWRRELWLWVMGERQWKEAAGLVYGGVLRQAGAPTPPPAVSPSSREPTPGGSG